jgi:hypothetical protein
MKRNGVKQTRTLESDSVEVVKHDLLLLLQDRIPLSLNRGLLQRPC